MIEDDPSEIGQQFFYGVGRKKVIGCHFRPAEIVKAQGRASGRARPKPTPAETAMV